MRLPGGPNVVCTCMVGYVFVVPIDIELSNFPQCIKGKRFLGLIGTPTTGWGLQSAINLLELLCLCRACAFYRVPVSFLFDNLNLGSTATETYFSVFL